MRTVSKHLLAALMGVAVLSSCSRPAAYFQPTARENFKAVPSQQVAVATPVETVQPTVVEESAVAATTPVAVPSASEQVAQAKQSVSQLDAYVRNDSKLASNKKLTKRMARLNELMTTAAAKTATALNIRSAKKTTFMERMVLKKMDKKIKNHVAPEKTNAMNSNVRLGIIIGIIGLLLGILGGGTVLGVIGYIALIVGIVLILLGLING